MVSKLKGYLLYIVVSVVGSLMLGNICLIYLNNHVISSNKEQQEVAERIKLNTLDVIRSLHLLDLAIRSYTFVKGVHFLNAANNEFEDGISGNAGTRYETALMNSYLLQILLSLITIPTLGYTAYYTRRNLFVSEQLRRSEEEKTKILEDQNRLLEKTVYERTHEILSQNAEISAQNEEMTAYNEQLLQQQREIELHRNSLSNQNESLIEVKRVIEERNLHFIFTQREKGWDSILLKHNLLRSVAELKLTAG